MPAPTRRTGVQPPSTTPSRTLRPTTPPNEPQTPATTQPGAAKACPTCHTPLDGGPVHFRCPSCRKTVMAADLDHETHAPLTVPAWANTPAHTDLEEAA
ncbi:hypothetical protein [Actinomadura oligospora]|uniref:hypothetical protein n=1 Tax=Actinomadura oligospora TaxID=111804 RepID=UPI0012FBA924|nr:hypothetical protein [Actinomadura oligospora]